MKTLKRPFLIPIFLSLFLAAGFMLLKENPANVSLAAPKACVAGPHSGLITADEEWCLADSPHVLDDSVTVEPGVTLTIEPGAVVKAPGWPWYIGLHVEGHLEAVGTPTQPITFTSTTGGPTWAGIFVDGGSANLAYTTVEFACGDSRKSNIAVINGGQLEMANSLVQECHYGGGAGERMMFIENGIATVQNTTFTASDEYPIYITGASSVVTPTNNIIIGNYYDRILLASGAMMGHDTILYPQTTWDGYELEGSLTVPPTVTLTVEPGAVVKAPGWPWYIGLHVEGHLEAVGTPTQPITFTSTTGGPTWAGIFVDGGSANLAYTTVEFACGDAMESNIAVINGGQLEIADSLVQECHFGGGAGERMLRVEDGMATVQNTTFTASDEYPIYITDASSVVTPTNNIIIGNYYDRILLASGAMMGHDTILYPQTTWDGYELEGSLTIPPTVTLTVEPGVIVQTPEYPYNIGVIVKGHLEAVGTTEFPITFTEVSGDINGWMGIVLDGGTAHLEQATIEKGCGGTIYNPSSIIRVINGGQVEIGDSLVQDCVGAPDKSLYIENGTATVHSTTFKDSDSEHIYVTGNSTVLIADSVIDGANENGLLIEGDQAWVVVTGSTILSNGKDGVRNTGEATVILGGDPEDGNWIFFNGNYGANQTGTTGQIIATYNWWGDASGPTHPTNPDGIGEEVSDRVLFDPWLTETMPPAGIDRFVWVSGDDKVSISGQDRNYDFFFMNVATHTLSNTLLIADLPWEAEYLNSTKGGIYWPLHHRVIWKLGDVPVGQTFNAVVQVHYVWGLPEGHPMRMMALVAAENMLNPRVDYAAHLAYQATTTLSEQELTEAEVEAILAADSELNDLYNYALDQGFEFFGTAVQRTLSDGSERVDLILLDRDRPGELLYVRRIGEDRHIRHETETDLEIYDLNGGARFNFATSSWEFWGDMEGEMAVSTPAPTLLSWTSYDVPFPSTGIISRGISAIDPSTCPDLSEGECLRNCLISREPQKMTEGPLWGQSNCQQCITCVDPDFCKSACTACAMDLWKENKDDGNYQDRCTYQCRDVLTRQDHKCTQDLEDCYPAARNESKFDRSEYRRVYTCFDDCRFEPVVPQLEYCPSGCSYGDTLGGASGTLLSCCEPVSEWWGGKSCASGTECPICNGSTCSPYNIIATVAHDPNALYGPEAAAPGQTLEYTIETENVGAGTAYGVFVESELPPELDASTLNIGGNGIYFPDTRKMFWEIGTLEPSAGDQVTFTVQVPAEAISGTAIVASATVHFPSVPEITPTNDVVTIIGDVIAYTQRVETVEGNPVAITLSGYTAGGEPLTYEILRQPYNGTLTGTPPDLTYTPADNFEGLDSLSFRVNDGTNISLPAEVLILVNTGTEAIPPAVLFTSPLDGESNVLVYNTPVYSDTYYPLIWAQFTEPINDATLTQATFYITDSDGRHLDGVIVYNGMLNRVQFVLNEPLSRNKTYTLTITTGVYDTSGNPMAADYVWSFSTEAIRIYLPLVARK